MTIQTEVNTVVGRGNGAAVVWPFAFRTDDAAHLVVQRRVFATGLVDKTYTSGEYVVAGIGDSAGGSVTITPALSSVHELVIQREVPYTQELDIQNQGGFFADAVESQLDNIVMQVQQVASIAGRSIRLSVGEIFSDLPSAEGRKNKYLAFDADGGPIVGQPPVVTSATGQSVTSKAALAAIAGPIAGQTAFLAGNSAPGNFVFIGGNQAALVTADPLQGLYVPPIADATGASGVWSRVWDGVHGRPEWFGAVTNSNNGSTGADNLAAMLACSLLCPVTVLGNADYWVSDMLDFKTPYRRVKGHPGDGYNTGTGTRIIGTNLAAPVADFGPDAKPASLASFMRGIECDNVTFSHTGVPPAPVAGQEHTAVPTVRRRWLFRPKFTRVSAWEPLIGFHDSGLVQPQDSGNKVLRTAAAPSGSDFCWASFVDGAPPFAGIPGNPSYTLDAFSMECSQALNIDKVGMVLTGDFSDLFISGVETSAATSGLRLLGSGAKAQINVRLRGCVFDQCTAQALDIQGLAEGACVSIEGGYYQSKATAAAVVHLRGGNGRVSISGGAQIVCGEAGTTIGVYVQGQPHVTIDDSVTFIECPRPLVVEGTSHGGVMKGAIANHVIGDGTQSAVGMAAQSRWAVAPTLKGKAGAFARGVHLAGTANTGNTIDPTGIEPVAVNGVANKVVVNAFVAAVQLTAPGYYTAAGAAGAAGAGNLVSGITA